MFRTGFCIFLCAAFSAVALYCNAGEPAAEPSPEIEKLIQQCLQSDKNSLPKALEKLAAQGAEAERALNWHLKKDAASRVRYAELIARAGFGKVGYRVVLELQPDGSGVVTMSSNRALLADCSVKYARITGQPEPNIDDDVLKYNPYSKVELIKHMGDGMKFQEGRVESKGRSIQAVGMVAFKSFDSFAAFGQSFDPDGYNMLSGASLTDTSDAMRTFQYKAVAEGDSLQLDKNLLLFHDVSWEFVLDFKGRVTRQNANKLDGSKLIWHFNCYQMLTGQALVQASFDATGLASRGGAKDTVTLPDVIQANQPIAIVKQDTVRARVYKKQPNVTPTTKDLRERGELVELDGRNSLPQGAPLEYRWTQVFGPDLNINPADLAKPWVCLIVKEPGEYRFELTVSMNNAYSKPAEVRVVVTDDKAATQVAAAPPEPVLPPKKIDPPVTPPEIKKDPPKNPETQVAKAPEVKPEPKTDTPKVATPEVKKTEPDKVTSGQHAAPPPETKKTTPVPPVPENKTVEPAVAQDPEKAKERYEEAKKLLKAFKYAEAKPILLHAAALSPDNNEIKYDVAATQFELGEYSDALPMFVDVANATRSARAMMYVGHCQARMKNLREAAGSYKRGAQVGHEQVEWESRWQMGNAELIQKNYKDALQDLKEADEMARKATVKDYRLLRDLAIAAHGCNKDGEALEYIKGLQALGYTPDPQLVADVLHAGNVLHAGSGTKTAKSEPPPVSPAKTDEPKLAVKPEPVKTPNDTPGTIADVNKGTEVASVKPLTQPDIKKPEIPAKVEPVKPATVETRKPDPAPENKQPAPTVKPEPVKPQPAKNDPPKTVEVAKPVVEPVPPKKTEPKKAAPKPQIPKKPLPPIPNDFNEAIASGKRALEEGNQLFAKSDDESKQKAAQSFDEAEAMFRGAWDQKPGDESVMTHFRELSKSVGAIAIPRSTYVKSKINGLTVLDASLSIVPKDRPMYCVWEQVAGEDLGQRPEKLAQKTVGIKIPRPGVYKFVLAVSDGIRGGNPVTVTVEVEE
jgi:tetratricopeptide (TPR) repeat protein